MHVPGDDGLRAEVGGEVAQERVPAGIAALERPLQLDEEAVAERPRELDRRVRVADAEPRARAAGEADESLARLGKQSRSRALAAATSPPSFGRVPAWAAVSSRQRLA